MFIESQPHQSILKITQNAIGLNGNQPMPPMILVDNNRGHSINLYNIMTVKNIGRIKIHKKLLHLRHTEVKKYHQCNIHSGISTPSIKYAPIIPNEPVQGHLMKNRPISSGS